MNRALALAFGISTALMLQACSSATRPTVPCDADHRATYFDLDGSIESSLRNKNGYFTNNPPTYPEDKANSCCSFWNDSIAAFCQSKVDAFCTSSYCSNPGEQERCSRIERERVKEVCLQAALVEYRRLIPVCAALQLKEQTPTWPNQGGEAVACPCAISTCSYAPS